MTDELTPEQEAAISRLLAEARHDEPIPADVAARLDAVLGDLSADDLEVVGTRPSIGTVTELAGVRHRRRNAARLLLAAAAVVVGGVAIGQNLGDRATGDADSAQAGDSAGLEPREDDKAAANAAGGSGDDSASAFGEDGGTAAESAPDAGSSDSDDAARLLDELNTPLDLTADNFEVEVQRNLSAAPGARRSAALSNLDAVASYAAMTLFTCPDGDYGDGARLPAYFDEQEAVLVLRRALAGVQRVDLLECGTAHEIASTDVPAR